VHVRRRTAFYRGIPDDFNAWADLGNHQWRFDEVLPYFGKLETDVDRRDDDHGTDGPIVVHHASRESWHLAQQAFYNALARWRAFMPQPGAIG